MPKAAKLKDNWDDIHQPMPDAVVDGQMVDWKFFEPPVVAPPLPKIKPFKIKPLEKMDDRAMAARLFSERMTQISRWVIVDDRGYHEFPREICHASLREIPESTSFFASNFDVPVGMEVEGEAYWQFMIGPRSPWRCLYEHGQPEKLFFKDGYQSGYVMNIKDITDEKKKTLVYNHCIAMRMIHEYPKVIKSWFLLQRHGLDEIEAFYFAKMFNILEKYPNYLVRSQNNDGCHWPLWFRGFEYYLDGPEIYKHLNFDRLYEGRPNFAGKSCHQWTEKVGGKFSDFLTNIESELIAGGAFSKTYGYPVEPVVKEFKEWMQKYREDIRKALGEVAEVQPEIESEIEEIEDDDDAIDDDYYEDEEGEDDE